MSSLRGLHWQPSWLPAPSFWHLALTNLLLSAQSAENAETVLASFSSHGQAQFLIGRSQRCLKVSLKRTPSNPEMDLDRPQWWRGCVMQGMRRNCTEPNGSHLGMCLFQPFHLFSFFRQPFLQRLFKEKELVSGKLICRDMLVIICHCKSDRDWLASLWALLCAWACSLYRWKLKRAGNTEIGQTKEGEFAVTWSQRGSSKQIGLAGGLEFRLQWLSVGLSTLPDIHSPWRTVSGSQA